MVEDIDIRPDRYYDSIRLMQATAAMRAVDGVEDAVAVMAGPAGRGFLADLGFVLDDAGAGPGDLVVAVRCRDEAARAAAHQALADNLSGTGAGAAILSGGGGLGQVRPHTVSSAARMRRADIALISVPGEHAFVEAMDALRAGLHVMLFSDNLSVDEEVMLKHEARRRDRLVMGPDCGTAIVGGVGLGFANAVELGPVSLVGASGTGIQQLCCLLDSAGVGVRHALGTGGRDLSAEVGGVSTLQALAALDRDPGTELIALVSKPPDPEVAARIEAAARDAATPVVTAFLGTAERTLEDAACELVRTLARIQGGEAAAPSFPFVTASAQPRPGTLRGLFAGGSLCAEARALVAAALGADPVEISDHTGDGPVLIDYGADAFTRGRGHPMIDQRVRLDRMAAAIDDPAVGVLLLDVVLGYGAHPDPASELAPVVARATGRGLAVVVSLCGTERDPQGRARQEEVLHRAGASVFASNAAAARHAASLIEPTSEEAQ
ncbi:FdrA family protein [Haliangium sp.]|uniref:FdrA family protein n=1 Tax=Haliangium sp. TaxID=2663208 RepID=UPI003D0C5503